MGADRHGVERHGAGASLKDAVSGTRGDSGEMTRGAMKYFMMQQSQARLKQNSSRENSHDAGSFSKQLLGAQLGHP